MASMSCVGIGTIQAFDATLQMASVSLNYKRVLKNAAMAPNNIDMVDVIREYPLLVKCPVVFLGGGAGRLTFPVAVGDPCVLFFCDRDMDTWIETGIAINPPNSERTHNLTDAIALVGIRSNASPLSSFNTLIASLIDKTGERLAQAGDVKATARTTAPSGWLLCYGQAISRTTYDILFAAIGTTYGAGNGSTTFNVPDLRGRTIVGLDNMGGSQAGRLTTTYTPNRNTLGGGVGEEAHKLTIPEMPIHNHPQNQCVHTNANSSSGFLAGNQMGTTGNTGGDVPHNTVQPGMMLNYIIKI
jgi:microcystin-dependent protein